MNWNYNLADVNVMLMLYSRKKEFMNPTEGHLKKAMDEVEEDHHIIMFLYKADRHRYGKLLEQVETTSWKKGSFFETGS